MCLRKFILERGYRTRDIPRLILEENIYGLDICDRASQLACFALLMKARKDDRHILKIYNIKLNILSIQDTNGTDAHRIAKILIKDKIFYFSNEDRLFPEFVGQLPLKTVVRAEVNQEELVNLVDAFRDAKTYGSLILLEYNTHKKLHLLKRLIEEKQSKGDMFERDASDGLEAIINQSKLLLDKYDIVVSNPPYLSIEI